MDNTNTTTAYKYLNDKFYKKPPYLEDRVPALYLDSWVSFYNDYVAPYQNIRTRVNALNKHNIICYILVLHLIDRDNDGADNGQWKTFFEISYSKKVDRFSQYISALNLCAAISIPEKSYGSIKKDCWTCSSIDKYGYPQTHFQENEMSKIGNQGYRVNNIKKENPLDAQIKGHRWFCSLNCVLRLNQQAAHRCGNQTCINPYHLKAVSDKENKNDLYCRNGCAHYCPHDKKCIWTVNGGWAPCRNDPNKATNIQDCPHNPNCYNK